MPVVISLQGQLFAKLRPELMVKGRYAKVLPVLMVYRVPLVSRSQGPL